jgi:hypothetical protein
MWDPWKDAQERAGNDDRKRRGGLVRFRRGILNGIGVQRLINIWYKIQEHRARAKKVSEGERRREHRMVGGGCVQIRGRRR